MHRETQVILLYGSALECCEPSDFNKLFVYALLKCISPQLLFIVFVFQLSIHVGKNTFSDTFFKIYFKKYIEEIGQTYIGNNVFKANVFFYQSMV